MEIEIVIILVVFVAFWIWGIWEFINSPMMPDDYDNMPTTSNDEWEDERNMTKFKRKDNE